METDLMAASVSRPQGTSLLPFGALSGLGFALACAVVLWPSGAFVRLDIPLSAFGPHPAFWALVAAFSLAGWLFARLRSRTRELEQAEALRVAEFQNMQERLRETAERLQGAERAKSEFLAAMSHELRTPLNAIIGFAEILSSEMLGPMGRREYVEYSSDIRQSGYQLLRVVNDILDLSRAQSGSIDLQTTPVDVEEVIVSTIHSLDEEAARQNISVGAEVAPEIDFLMADEVRLRQILTHLISNGIKFTPSGGRVTVAARSEPGTLLITVADTGIGIAQEHIEQALRPFGQVDGSRDREYQGTGLGLPLTRSLVALHGGSFAIDSSPGKGTTVTLGFPCEGTLAAGLAA